MEFYNVVKRLRRQKGISQETLAEVLGISPQAVSKWECGLSYPDIELLPVLAEHFKVSIDFLLTGVEHIPLDGSKHFADEDTLYIVQYKGGRILTKSDYDPDIRIKITAEDTANSSMEIWGSVDIAGNITGNVEGEYVSCGNITGNVEGKYVSCGNINGDVCASGAVNCGNVEGNIVSSHGDIHCHEVRGAVNCAQTVYVKQEA